ncbi:hypothetical protein ACWGID_39025 [Kribbella sp. NPDC054772]
MASLFPTASPIWTSPNGAAVGSWIDLGCVTAYIGGWEKRAGGRPVGIELWKATLETR